MKRSCFIFVMVILAGRLLALDNPRPKVGLVLSGGGARGFAHIGLLSVLDSLQIPVDYVVGTSMGGIMGAMYAIGYPGREIEEIALTTDWEETFTDEPPREALPYFQKKDNGRYLLDFGFDNFHLSLPSGLIFGQKVSLLFLSHTFPYENVKNFDELPIPFRCVAVNIVTGKEVVLQQGSLARAIRSTMAIPTVFSAVDWGDSLLVDGGLLNNLPVDVVKKMGADIIIAVDVGPPLKGRDKLNSAVAILEQSIAMLGKEKHDRNVAMCDLVICPRLNKYTVADFTQAKVPRIIQKGYKAAWRHLDDLKMLKTRFQLNRVSRVHQLPDSHRPMKIAGIQITGYQSLAFDEIIPWLSIQSGDVMNQATVDRGVADLEKSGLFESVTCQLIPVSDEAVQLVFRVSEKKKPVIFGINIVGNQRLPFGYIYNLLGLKPRDELDTADLNRRIMEMYGLGYFQQISYEIEPRGDNRVHLTLIVKEHARRKLRLGLHYDDRHKLVAVVGLHGMNFLLPGLRYEHEYTFAGYTQIYSKVYYPSRTLNLPVYPFVRFLYKNKPIHIFSPLDGSRIASYKDRTVLYEAGLGFLLSRSLNFEAGYQHEMPDVAPRIAPVDFPHWTHSLRKVRLSLNLDMLDSVLLPHSGLRLKVFHENAHFFSSDVNYDVTQVSGDFYHTFAQRHTVRLYGFHGFSHQAPVYKYLNQGAPSTFVGMDYDQLYGTQMSVFRMEYRWRVRTNLYAKVMGNTAFNLEDDQSELDRPFEPVFGMGAGLKLITPVGPVEFIVSRGSRDFVGSNHYKTHIYIHLGACLPNRILD